MMSFSVDYCFTLGQPNPTSQYVWVIDRAEGPPAKLQGALNRRGTLQTLIPKWRARHGPFRTHLEDTNGNRLSQSIALQ